jgi:CRISPR-associated protein Csd1
MIANLVALYERLGPELPRPGWQEREISFVIDLDEGGHVVRTLTLREPQAKGRARAPLRLVPQEARRTGKIPDTATEADCGKASLCWDNPKYALGVTAEDGDKARRQAQVCHALFRLRHARFACEAGLETEAGMQALLRFLNHPTLPDEDVTAIRDSGGNVAFRLYGDADLLCRRPAIRNAISAQATNEEGGDATGQCLVTGRVGRIRRIHPVIQGVAGAQTSGANIVSFNKEAFESYGLSQGANAPVGAYAVFAYTTALNWLLRADSPFRARAGSTSVVFWAGAATPNETFMCDLLTKATQDDLARGRDTVERTLTAPLTGTLPRLLGDATPFFILGLSAESKSRLTVRFFYAGTIAAAAAAIARWFKEIAIVPTEGPPPSLMRLLAGLSVQGDLKNAPPLLAADLLRAVYAGTNLPQRAFGEALVRCAAERGPTRERAALIKAFLIRNQGRKIGVALDPDEPDPAYRLGRLFAVLENLQRAAVKPKNTIRDSYWGSASATPATVFPQLLDLAMNHLSKVRQDRGGLAHWFEQRIGEITAGLPPALPGLLAFEQQGRFAIGYWHQRFAPKPDKIAAEEAAALAEEGDPA